MEITVLFLEEPPAKQIVQEKGWIESDVVRFRAKERQAIYFDSYYLQLEVWYYGIKAYYLGLSDKTLQDILKISSFPGGGYYANAFSDDHFASTPGYSYSSTQTNALIVASNRLHSREVDLSFFPKVKSSKDGNFYLASCLRLMGRKLHVDVKLNSKWVFAHGMDLATQLIVLLVLKPTELTIFSQDSLFAYKWIESIIKLFGVKCGDVVISVDPRSYLNFQMLMVLDQYLSWYHLEPCSVNLTKWRSYICANSLLCEYKDLPGEEASLHVKIWAFLWKYKINPFFPDETKRGLEKKR